MADIDNVATAVLTNSLQASNPLLTAASDKLSSDSSQGSADVAIDTGQMAAEGIRNVRNWAADSKEGFTDDDATVMREVYIAIAKAEAKRHSEFAQRRRRR